MKRIQMMIVAAVLGLLVVSSSDLHAQYRMTPVGTPDHIDYLQRQFARQVHQPVVPNYVVGYPPVLNGRVPQPNNVYLDAERWLRGEISRQEFERLHPETVGTAKPNPNPGNNNGFGFRGAARKIIEAEERIQWGRIGGYRPPTYGRWTEENHR